MVEETMLSKFTLNLIKYVLRTSNCLGCIHFYIDKQYNVQRTTGIFHKSRHLLNLSVHWFSAFRILSRLFTVVLGKSNLPSSVFLGVAINSFFYSICYCNLLFFQLHSIYFYTQIPYFVQCYLSFYTVSKEPPRRKNKGEFTKTIKVLLGFLAMMLFQNAALMIKKPELPQIYTSVLENPKQAHYLKKLPLMGLYMYSILSAWVSISFKLYESNFLF